MDEKNLPKISVVTPCLNSLPLLKQTVDSVFGNKYPNLEYVITDARSTDGTSDFIKSIEKKLYWWCSEKDNGPYEAINKGFAHTTGDIMTWLNAGDLYFPRTLHEITRIFSEFPDIDWIMGLPSKIQDGVVHNIKNATPYPREFIRAGLYLMGDFGPIQQESCFWRRNLWERTGALREDLALAADFELWTRFAEFSELVCVGTLLSGFSIHKGQNRSIVHFDKYKEEVSKTIDEFPRDIKQMRKKILRELNIFKKVKNYTGLRGLTRRVLNLNKYSGKVLEWDFDKEKYDLRTRTYL